MTSVRRVTDGLTANEYRRIKVQWSYRNLFCLTVLGVSFVDFVTKNSGTKLNRDCVEAERFLAIPGTPDRGLL